MTEPFGETSPFPYRSRSAGGEGRLTLPRARGRDDEQPKGMGEGETFAQRLRRLRREQGLSVTELASAASASEGTIRQLEAGNVKSPAFVLGLRLATALSVDPYYLALGAGFNMRERFEVLERRMNEVEHTLAGLASARIERIDK